MKTVWRMLIYLLLVTCVLGFLMSRLNAETGTVLSELEFTTYDNVLYSPEEYAQLSEEELAKGYVGWDYDYQRTYDEKPFSRVRTNVMELELEPGRVYGIYCEQFTYAARLYVDGVLLAELGTVSETPEGYVPRTGSVTVYFTAGEKTQILTQRCSFDHVKWNAFQLYLGPQDVITRQVQIRYLSNAAMLTVLLTLCLVNLGMFVGLPKRREFLWSALFALFLLVNSAFNDPKLIMLLFPKLNWYLGHKLESTAIIFMGLFVFLLFQTCLGNRKRRWITWVGLAMLLGAALFVFLFPARIYTKYSTGTVRIAAGLCAVYFLTESVRGLLHWRKLQGYQKYCIIGFGIVILTAAGAVVGFGPAHFNTLLFGLALFELVLTLGLSIEFQSVETSYETSKRNEERLQEMNKAMEQNQELQENFMAIMNHEMRTPLTVIAGYADLSARQLAMQDGQDEEMIRSLHVIQQEALRLGRIVEQSEGGVRTAIAASEAEPVRLLQLLEDAKAFCQPICEKRNNRIMIDCDEAITAVCMRDSMLQALYNLILNASRHTKDGTIHLSAVPQGEEALVCVRDDGDGMSQQTMRRAFDRGFTTDGGHGLGLPLCKEILERQNGRIWIEPNPDRGISVLLTLPLGRPE